MRFQGEILLNDLPLKWLWEDLADLATRHNFISSYENNVTLFNTLQGFRIAEFKKPGTLPQSYRDVVNNNMYVPQSRKKTAGIVYGWCFSALDAHQFEAELKKYLELTVCCHHYLPLQEWLTSFDQGAE